MNCLICCEERNLYTVGKCNHSDICLECTIKIRILNKNNNCTICKEDLDNVIITDNYNDTFNKYKLNNLKEYKNKIFYGNNWIEKLCQKYISIKCPLNCKNKEFIDENLLKKHLKEEHQRYFCNWCLKNRSLLLSEHTLYRKNELDIHQKNGDYDNEGNLLFIHPYCQFCNELFYNEEIFLNHLKKNHYNCNICEKLDEYKFYYYKDYNSLNKHFDKSHYICPFDECKEKLFIVFFKIKELENHIHLKHNNNNKNKKNLINYENYSENKFIIKDKEGIDISNNLLTQLKLIKKNNKVKNFNNYIDIREIISYSKEISILNWTREEEIDILNNKNNKSYLLNKYSNYYFLDYYNIPYYDSHSWWYKDEFIEKIQLVLNSNEEKYIVDSINKFYKKIIKPINLFDIFFDVFGDILCFKYYYYFIKTIKIYKLALILDDILSNEWKKLYFKNKCLLSKNKIYSFLFKDIYNKLCELFLLKIKNKIINENSPFKWDKNRLFQLVSGINHLSLYELSKFKLLNHFIKNPNSKTILYESLFEKNNLIIKHFENLNHFDLHILIIYFNLSNLKFNNKNINVDTNLNQNLTKTILRHYPQFCKEINYDFESDDEDYKTLTQKDSKNQENNLNCNKKIKNDKIKLEDYKQINILEHKHDSMKYKIDDKYDFPTLDKTQSQKVEIKTDTKHWGGANILVYKNKKAKIDKEDFPELGKESNKKKIINQKMEVFNPIGSNNKEKINNNNVLLVKQVKKKKRRK